MCYQTASSPSLPSAYFKGNHNKHFFPPLHTQFDCNDIASGIATFGKQFHNMSLSALFILYFLHSLGLSISSFPFQAARIFWQTPCFLPPKYCIHIIFFLFVAQILLFDTALGINRQTDRQTNGGCISLKCISVTFPVDSVREL